MRIGRIVLVVLLGVLVVGGLGGSCMMYGSYKESIRLDEGVKSSWADVEVVLKRRFDLIPNVVETVKGYAKHEKDLLQGIADVRKSYFAAQTPSDKAKAATQMDGFLSRLLVLQETYPQLKADQSFRALQVELEGTENRIAEMRKRYNDSVRALNTYIRGPINSIAANWAHVKSAEYFEAGQEAKEVPKVDFKT